MFYGHFTSIFSLAVLAASVDANTVFSQLHINGVAKGLGVGIRVPSSNKAITDINSQSIICNTGYQSPVSQTVFPVDAGAQVTAEFHRTPAGYQGVDPGDPLDPTDKGPVLAYLAKIPDAKQTNVTGLQWFKIFQDGLTQSPRQWGTDRLFIGNGLSNFTIPSCLASGQYLLRAEVVGLEYASAYPGAEFWMSCAQLEVTNKGTPVIQPATVSFPGAYNSGIGIETNVYSVETYTPPGPEVFKC